MHWFSLLNSFMIVLFLQAWWPSAHSSLFDIAKYNASALGDEAKTRRAGSCCTATSSARKFDVAGGVCRYRRAFGRRSSAPWVLPCSASRVRRIAVAYSHRFCCSSSFAGRSRVTARRDCTKHLAARRGACTVASAALFPGIVFAVFFVLNLCVWSTGSSGRCPSARCVRSSCSGSACPRRLVFAGSYRGFKATPYEMPVRTNQIARQIPQYRRTCTLCSPTAPASCLSRQWLSSSAAS